MGELRSSQAETLVRNSVDQGFPDRGPRAQIWAPDRLCLGPLGLKYMPKYIRIWAFGP